MSAWQDLSNKELTGLPTNRLYEVYKRCRKTSEVLDYEHFECGYDNDWQKYAEKRAFIKAELDTRGWIQRDPPSEPSKKKG